MGRVVVKRGSPDVREEGMPPESNESHQRGPVLSDDRVRNVRAGSRPIKNGRKASSADVEPGRPNPEEAPDEGSAENLHLAVNWDACGIAEGEAFVVLLMEEVSRGRARLRDRASEMAKSFLHCSNPECLKPLKSEQSCVSIWTVKSPVSGIERTIYSCSERCHVINNHHSAEERVVKT